MGRKKIETGISYDKDKKLYYAVLSRGTDEDGKSTKSYKTAKTLTEARAICKEHKAKKQRGEVVPANADTFVKSMEHLIDQRALSLQKSTI